MALTQNFQGLCILALVSVISCQWFNSPTLDPSKFVDLTQILDENTFHPQGHKLSISPLSNLTIPMAPGLLVFEQFRVPVHIGTHMDVPFFVDKSLPCAATLPLNLLILPAVVVDISDRVGDNPRINLNPWDLMTWESRHGRIPNGSLLLVRTGWSKYWSNPLKYSGRDTFSGMVFPTVSKEASKWLVDNRKVIGVGIDSVSVDAVDAEFSSHNNLLSKGIYNVENLNNLDLLPHKGATVFILPIKIKGMSGAPVRAIAYVP